MILKFEPIALEKVWGGNKLSKQYGIKGDNIGEIWGISAHRSYSNVIAHGVFKGLTFRALYQDQKKFFGGLESDEFPLLFKIIDAKGDLSIQVHPDDQYAQVHEHSYGKDECWYILDTDSKDTEIIIGHHAKNKNELIKYINTNKTEEIVNRFKIKPKDYFYIASGTVHAICKDTTLLEVSQSSDITYRVYDYNRLDKGNLRALHIDQSLDVIKIPDSEIQKKHVKTFFDFQVFENKNVQTRKAHQYGDYIYIIKGKGLINNEAVHEGEFLMITSHEVYQLEGCFEFALITITKK